MHLRTRGGLAGVGGGGGDLAADGAGYVDCEQGEHYHAHDGEDCSGDFSGGGYGEYAASGGGDC